MSRTKKVVLSHIPSHYPRQRKKQCGLFTVKAVLDSFDIEKEASAWSYAGFLSRIFLGYTSPLRICRLLRKRGLYVQMGFSRRKTNKQKLAFLKKQLRADRTLILLISSEENKYLQKKKYRHLVNPHWVSLWGYDDSKEEFYVYNSLVVPEHHHKVPVGNVAMSYDQVLRLWKCSSFYRPLGFLYFTVELPRTKAIKSKFTTSK